MKSQYYKDLEQIEKLLEGKSIQYVKTMLKEIVDKFENEYILTKK